MGRISFAGPARGGCLETGSPKMAPRDPGTWTGLTQAEILVAKRPRNDDA